MRFWDSSAIVPLCLAEPESPTVRGILKRDPVVVVWWATPVECWSTFSRLRREGILGAAGDEHARRVLHRLQESWTEVVPSEAIRNSAGRLLRLHPLRAADALQLGAALQTADDQSIAYFVTFDRRLGEAARLEGLTPLP